MNKSMCIIQTGMGGALTPAIKQRSLVIIAASALFAGAEMAQDALIKFGGWCSLNMSLVGYNGENITATNTVSSWDSQNARVGLSLAVVSKYAGFEMCINADPEGGNLVGVNDLAYGWVKPFAPCALSWVKCVT